MSEGDQEDRKISLVEVSSMLHGVLFGLEKVLMTRYNVDSKVLIPYILEELDELFVNLDIIDKNKNLEENIKAIEKYFSNEEVLKGIKITKEGKNKYSIEIKKCNFATSGVHDLLQMEKGSCPWSLIISTILQSGLRKGKHIDVGESDYSDKGSKTNIIIKEKD
jgi:hypothetical protein